MSAPNSRSGLRARNPRERVAALDDAGAPHWLDAWRPSPHLADRGLEAQDDDGVVTAGVRIAGASWLVAAQDERFLGGSVGAEHAKALRALFERALRERPAGIALLAASGGVRLHEANAAELELARALRALLDVRVSGIPAAAIAVGDVFGGASVLACATGRIAALPGVRLGLSGPKVVEAALGRAELDATDASAVEALYGSAARARDGHVEALRDDSAAAIEWLLRTTAVASFEGAVVARAREGSSGQAIMGPSLDPAWSATPVAAGLWRSAQAWIVAPSTGQPVAAAALRALDDALLRHVSAARDPGPPRLILLEDSPGHAVSRAAEAGFLSRDLAEHAAVLAVLRERGIRIAGALVGIGHSAAFFANALQADALCAVPGARVIAMAPEAIARVTGVNAQQMIEHDRLLGQPVRHFAALGGIRTILPDATPEGILHFAMAI